jgi:hypothetical protein
MLVTRGDERKAISDKYFMRGKRESKVGLRKGGDCSAKITSESLSCIWRYTNREKSGFMIVDGEPSSLLEDLQNVFSLSNGFSGAFEKDEGIICVLEHGAGGIGNQRMFDGTCQIGMMKKPAKNVSNNNKEVSGERIPLMKTIPTVNPPP